MKTTEKQKTADALTEKSVWMRIGLLPIRMRPLTLGQIYELGVYTNDLHADGLSLQQKRNLVAEMLYRYEDARLMQETFLIVAFRKRWARRLFRRYILGRLTVRKYQTAVTILFNTIDANFFLTSIIFLNQMNPMTEPRQTTVHGPQSEE